MSESARQHPYSAWAADFAAVVRRGQSLPLGGFPPAPRPEIRPEAPKALFFAPHPDDETIQGGLALRLLREARWRVINVAVTQGSKPPRQQPRWEELKAACHFLGFDLRQTAPGGLAPVTPEARANAPEKWAAKVKIISTILAEEKPQAIFFPHEHDWNDTHIGTHFLVMDALRETTGLRCAMVETEFWGQNDRPNLMVEYDSADVADLIAATTFHVGEVERNPYHVTALAWMLDNVRRGAELVGGQGGAAPAFLFGQLFQLRRWNDGRVENIYEGGRFLPKTAAPDSLFGV